MTIIPFGEWLPDLPALENPGASTISNVYPRTAKSYGAFAGYASAGLSAMAERCQGALGARDSAGNTYNFAGTATKLYEATSGATSWSDVSVSGGYSISSEEQWHFAQFGDVFYACNISDPIQAFTLGSSTAFAELATGAPKARYLAMSRNFLLAGNTTDSTNGAKPQRIWWSAIGDPTNWPTLGTSTAAGVQSDAQDVTGNGWITGIVPAVGGVDAIVFFEKSISRAMYIGSPDVWGFYPVNGVRGCPVPGSIQQTEIGVIYLGPDDFYLFDGNTVPVGIGHQKIAKTFYADVDQSYLARICSVVDPINKLYIVAYPSLSTGGGVLDKILVCNYQLQSVVGTPGRWAPITPTSNLEFLFLLASFGYTVDNFTSGTGYNVDTAPAGPDSRLWTGDKDILSAIDTTHTLQYFSGSNLAPTVQTSEAQLLKNRRAAVEWARPIVDGGTPSVTPYIRNRIVDTATAATTSTMDGSGYCYFRDAEAFYHRFQLTLPAASTFTHLQGIDIPDDALIETGIR